MGFILAVVIAPVPAGAADLDDVSAKLLRSRELYSEMRDMLVVYVAKSNVALQFQALAAERGEQLAVVRQLQVTVDGFPPRRNSEQQAVYQQLLGARRVLTEYDRQIDAVKSNLREIDEQALALTAMNMKRPVPGNRRDIQVVFPIVQKECLESFGELKHTAERVAASNRLSREQILDQAMLALGPPKVVDAQFGSRAEFVSAFRQYCSGRRSFVPEATRDKRKRRR
jgi:hypothetical protein